MAYTNPVKKIIPSKLETGFQKFLYKHVGPHIPSWMTPNQVTLVGAIGCLLAIIFTLLTNISMFFFIGTIVGLIIHLVADDLDGYVARSRGMSSKEGAFFDLTVDVLFTTFLMISLGFTPYANMYVMVFAVPVYGVINVTMMNYIIYYNEFLFPKLGPIEAHLTYVLLCVLSMVFAGNSIFEFANQEFFIADIVVAIGLIPMYFEMFRLKVNLFNRLKKDSKTDV